LSVEKTFNNYKNQSVTMIVTQFDKSKYLSSVLIIFINLSNCLFDFQITSRSHQDSLCLSGYL